MKDEVLKTYKRQSTDLKADVKQQEIKELVAVSCNFLQEVPSKLDIQCKTGMHFSFNFAWYSIKLDIVR